MQKKNLPLIYPYNRDKFDPPVSGYDGVTKETVVYSVKIIFDDLGDFIIKTVTPYNEHILIGRDILNRWSLFLKGRNRIFEVS